MTEFELAAETERLEAALKEGRRRQREQQVENSRILARLRDLGVPRRRSMSFRQYAETQGFGVVEATELTKMAEAAAMDARVEPLLVSGALPMRSASNLRRALQLPPPDPSTLPAAVLASAPAGGWDWVSVAVRVPSERFRDLVSAAAARTRPNPPSRQVFWLEEEDARSFRHARRLAMRVTQSVLTEGQAIGVVSRFYLEKKDRRLRRVMRRRLARGLSVMPGQRSRRVPEHVRREVAIRDQDACQVGLCPDDVFLEDGHVYESFAKGGASTTANLGRQCHGHNDQQRLGWLKVVPTERGPVYVDRDGYVIEHERRPDDPRRRLEEYLKSLAPP